MTKKAPLNVSAVYWLPYCSTCVKAEQFLLEHGADIQAYVNLKTESMNRETLIELAEGVGGVSQLFSKRAMKYRALGLHEKTLSDEEMLNYMQEEYTFVKRPVIVTNRGVRAGFSKKQYLALFEGA